MKKWNALFVCLVMCLPAVGQRVIIDDVEIEGELDVSGGITREGLEVLTNVETPGGAYLPEFFILDSLKEYRDVMGSPSTNTVTDAVVETFSNITAATDYQLIVTDERNETGAAYAYTSSNEAVATVDSSGFVSWVSDGTATLTATLGSWSDQLDLTFSSNNQTVHLIVDGVATYLLDDLISDIDAALTADAGANDDELFDTRDWATHTYVRNTSSWAYAATGGSDPWTGLAVWRTGKTSTALGQSIRGTAISEDVIAFAWHNRPSIGTEFKWLGTDNQIYTRSVSAIVRVGSTDAGVGLLSSPLPPEVQPVKLLPGSFSDHLFYDGGTYGLQIPAISVNRNLQAMVFDVNALTGLFGQGFKSQLTLREGYYQAPVNGDSGSPILWVLNGNLVLLWTWWTPAYGSSFVSSSVLDTAIATLGGKAPTVTDLSAYPQSGPPTP